MRTARAPARPIVVALSLLAVLQIVWLGVRASGGAAPPPPQSPLSPPVLPGDTLAHLSLLDADGIPTRLPLAGASPAPTVVLAFFSGCVHCATVAPAWAEWERRWRHRVRIIAITRDPVGEAQAYRHAHGWDFPVFSLADPDLPAPERYMVSRTPWWFIFRPDGVFEAGANGALLSRADSLLSRLVGQEAMP